VDVEDKPLHNCWRDGFQIIVLIAARVYGTEPCRVLHGRARFYSGDSQLRIWEIGTHHEYRPDDSSSDEVIGWLEAGVPKSERTKYVTPASVVDLYADFLVCPTEPFRKGSVQQAKLKSASHRHYVKTTE
jgi:hypothetical protein